MIIQQERHNSLSSPADEPNIFVNSSSGKGRGGGHPTGQSSNNNRNFSTKKCVYCGRNGHTVDICYAKHGYPISHPRYPGRSRFHTKDGSSSFANVNNVTQEADSPHSSMTLSSPSNGLGYGFTKAQYQSLLGLLQQQSNGSATSSESKHANLTHVPSIGISEPSNMDFGFFFTITDHLINAHTSHPSHNTSWVIDSGATDHITYSFDNFQNFSKIQPIHINLPNGSIVIAHISGIFQLSFYLTIHDVLYVPNFKFNLLSISKLLTSSDYTLLFSNFQCQIQEKKSLRMIGLSKLKHGLYHLETHTNSRHSSPQATFINNFSTPPVTNANLWHFRLGHLSGNRLNTLHAHFPFISKHVDENCDIVT